ncbi:MAG: polysaccharide biosynthesis C-terminal domain-containing protein, partial [Anaerotignaceae bacterium]
CLGYTAIIGFGFAIVFAAFPSQICNFVYKQKELGEILLPLSVMCPLFYMHITISGILNGLGRHRFIFNQNLISSAINLLFIYFLMPKWGITALVVGMSVSLIITLSLGFREIYISGKIKLNLLSNLGLPLICSLSALTLSKIIFAKINIGSESFIIPSVLMGFIYLILLLVTGTLKKEDVLFLK